MNQDKQIQEIENAFRSDTNSNTSGSDTDSSGISNAQRSSGDEGQGRTIEDVARAQGWRPAEEFTGDPADWVSAETFVERGRLLKVIHKKNQESVKYQDEMEKMKKAVFDMKDMLNKAQEHALKQARDEVRAEKIAALKAGEMERAVSLDEELDKLDKKEEEYRIKAEKEKQEFETPVTNTDNKQDPFSDYYKTWVVGNDWYLRDKAMKARADMYGRNYVESNPDAEPEDVFKFVDEWMHKDYPDKFKQQDTTRSPDVISRNVTTGSRQQPSNKVDIRKLTAEQREVAENFAQLGVMSVEEFAKQVLANK